MSSRSALLLGATGLVRGRCLELLLARPMWSRVVVLGRRKLPRTDPKLEQHVVEFNQLDAYGVCFEADDVFCCLGTTIKQAGSEGPLGPLRRFRPIPARDVAAALVRLADERDPGVHVIESDRIRDLAGA